MEGCVGCVGAGKEGGGSVPAFCVVGLTQTAVTEGAHRMTL